MTNRNDLKKLLVTGLLTWMPLFATAGGGDAGGAQGTMDQKGNFYFLDILSKPELSNLEDKLISSDRTNIISDIKCSNEQYRDLNEYEFGSRGNPLYEPVYPVEGKFETEVAEAKKLLSAASKALVAIDCPDLEGPYHEGMNKMPNLANMLPARDFKVTAFKLPQYHDATQVYGEYQNQIAYYEYGETYFQHQALLRLKTKARAVFIKETLRTINGRFGLKLRNLDLETATYFIYHGEIENFDKSVFVGRMRNKFPQVCRELTLEESIGSNFYGNYKEFPGWLSYLETTDFQKVAKSGAPEGKTWSTRTGRLLNVDSCNSQK